MIELSQKILSDYQVRKSNGQKQRFLDLIKTAIPEAVVQESKFPRNRNIVIGDIQNAKIVLTAHYDTCPRLPFPNFITPKNILFYILYNLLIIVPMVAAVFLLNFLLGLITDDYWLHYTASILVYFGILFLMTNGPANKHTANDNTSGVITLLEIYYNLTPEERKSIVFIFFDNEEKGLIGSSSFRRENKKIMKEKLLINYDCVADGDFMLLSASKAARKEHGELLQKSFVNTKTKHVLLEKAEWVVYPSDQAGFPCSIAVAAMKKNKFFGYYMDKIHTKNDTAFDQENIQYLTESTMDFVRRM